jgi:hypothetical protein
VRSARFWNKLHHGSKGIFQHDIATPLQLNELASLVEIRHHHRITKIKQEEFEDIKGVIRIVNRRRTGNTMTKIIRTNTNLQNNTQNSKYRETRTPLRTRDEIMRSERDSDYPFDIFKLFLLYFSDTMMMSNFNKTGQFI